MLAYQRYGRGKAIAMPIQDSWLWQMDAKVPVTDTTHATFWRRLVRWLVDGVPEQVNVTTTARSRRAGRADQADGRSARLGLRRGQRRRVVAHVTSPSGKTSDVPLEWTVDARRRLPRRASSRTRPGSTTVSASRARRRGSDRTLGTERVMHVRASAGDSEYFDAAMRAPLLKRIAEETGGRFFTPANAVGAARGDQLQRPRRHRRRRARAVGHAGRCCSLLIGLIGAEWGYRRDAGARVSAASRGTQRRAAESSSATRVSRLRAASACCARRAPPPRRRHLLVITGVPRRRGAREAVPRLGDDASSTRRRRATACPTPTSRYLAEKPDADPAHSRALDEGERREGVRRHRGAGAARRRHLRAAHRPRQLRRHAAARSTCPGPT